MKDEKLVYIRRTGEYITKDEHRKRLAKLGRMIKSGELAAKIKEAREATK